MLHINETWQTKLLQWGNNMAANSNRPSEINCAVKDGTTPFTPDGWINTEKKTIIAFRLIVGLAVFALFWGQQQTESIGWQFYFLGTLFLASNLVFLLERDQVFTLERIQFSVLLFDLVMICVLAIYLSAARMEFYIVLFLTVFIAAASKKLIYAFGASVVMGGLYFVLESAHVDVNESVLTTSFFAKTTLFFCISCFVGYISDLAETRKANIAKLSRHANKMTAFAVEQNKMASIGVLAGGVAHEFNNIIAGIQGYLELAEMNAVDQAELLKVIYANCNRAAGIIRDLLTFSRKNGDSENGVEPETILEQVIRMLDKECNNNNVEIILRAKEVSRVRLPEGLFDRIALNLLKNAITISEHESKIIVTLEETDGVVKFSVKDFSDGVFHDSIVNILDPSFDENTLTGKSDKTIHGIDLAVSKYLVCEFGGELVVNTDEDEGTTIEVSLPTVSVMQEVDLASSQIHKKVTTNNENSARDALLEHVFGQGS